MVILNEWEREKKRLMLMASVYLLSLKNEQEKRNKRL